MMILRTIVATLLLASSTFAADLTINSFECNDALPITATDASLDCYPHDGYCMLGQDVTIKAKCEFFHETRHDHATMVRCLYCIN